MRRSIKWSLRKVMTKKSSKIKEVWIYGKKACNVYHQKGQIDVERESGPYYRGYGAGSEADPLEPREKTLY